MPPDHEIRSVENLRRFFYSEKGLKLDFTLELDVEDVRIFRKLLTKALVDVDEAIKELS